jgi:hypothetical protein
LKIRTVENECCLELSNNTCRPQHFPTERPAIKSGSLWVWMSSRGRPSRFSHLMSTFSFSADWASEDARRYFPSGFKVGQSLHCNYLLFTEREKACHSEIPYYSTNRNLLRLALSYAHIDVNQLLFNYCSFVFLFSRFKDWRRLSLPGLEF